MTSNKITSTYMFPNVDFASDQESTNNIYRKCEHCMQKMEHPAKSAGMTWSENHVNGALRIYCVICYIGKPRENPNYMADYSQALNTYKCL